MTSLEHDPRSASSSAAEPNRLSVLLVEDDENEVYFLRTLFNDAPDSRMTFIWAATCAIAFEKLQLQHFDVVLLDLNLTDSFGPSTFYRFLHEAPEVPVVVLTSMDNEGLAATMVRDGAQDYLVKSQTNSAILVRAIRFAIERHRTRLTSDRVAAARPRAARILGFLGVKGGVGTTTVALNIAGALANQGKAVIAIELRSDPGSFSFQLGVVPFRNISTLLALSPREITPGAVASHLTEWPYGLKALFGPQDSIEVQEPVSADCARAIIQSAAKLADFVILDLPPHAHYTSAFRAALEECHFLTLVTDRDYECVHSTVQCRGMLLQAGVKEGSIGALVITRDPFNSNITLPEVSTIIRCPIVGVMPPLPEEWRAKRRLEGPYAVCNPDSAAASTLNDAADRISGQRVSPMKIHS